MKAVTERVAELESRVQDWERRFSELAREVSQLNGMGEYRIIEQTDGRFYPQISRANGRGGIVWQSTGDHYFSLADAKKAIRRGPVVHPIE